MRLIAHRGNLDGRIPEKENHPDYINAAITGGFDVEVDVWYDPRTCKWSLGHDEPQYETSSDFLKHPALWCHAKNMDALEEMLKEKIHCFWHDGDKCTLTSKNILWCYPGIHSKYGVTVNLSETVPPSLPSAWAICTDIPIKWREVCRFKPLF
jgi:hypothetical protein